MVKSFSCFAFLAMVKISLSIIANNPRQIHPVPKPNSNFKRIWLLKIGVKKLLRIYANPTIIKDAPMLLKFLIINELNIFNELKL
jgi:hypothetical protein